MGWAVSLGRKIKDWKSNKKLSCENEGVELSSGDDSVLSGKIRIYLGMKGIEGFKGSRLQLFHSGGRQN